MKEGLENKCYDKKSIKYALGLQTPNQEQTHPGPQTVSQTEECDLSWSNGKNAGLQRPKPGTKTSLVALTWPSFRTCLGHSFLICEGQIQASFLKVIMRLKLQVHLVLNIRVLSSKILAIAAREACNGSNPGWRTCAWT